MDFDLTEEQGLLQDSVTKLLATSYAFEQRKAMQAATANGAELLRLPLVGTIEEGKEADLVMFDGNPAEAIEHVVSPLLVLKAGDVVNGSLG